MNVLIVGYGKMGQLVDALAGEQGIEVAGRVDDGRDEWAPPTWPSTSPLPTRCWTISALPPRRLPVVIGTTGWNAHLRRLREEAERAGLGVVASANFSIGVNIFQLVVAEAARLMAAQPQYGAWIHEAHHAAKRDAPSGTALMLRDAMIGAGFDRAIDMSSARAGTIPGIHTVGFDAASDTIELFIAPAIAAVSPPVRLAARMDSRPAGVVHDGRRPAGLPNETEPRTKPRAPGREPTEDRRSSCVLRLPALAPHSSRPSPRAARSMRRRSSAWRAADRRGRPFPVPCGTTGESPTLTHREKLRVVELVVEEAAGKVPVMAGAGGYDTREAIELSRDMEKVGADGLLQVTPYYNKPTQEGLYQHFKAIAESTPLPIMLYSVQGRTGVNIRAATTVRLAQIPNIVGIKEASGPRPDDRHRRQRARGFPAAERRRSGHGAGDGDRRHAA